MIIQPKVIDIYHGDTVTSFAQAYAFGIRGVIHKATEGGAIVDPAYAARRKLAAAAGMLWGAYHFMRPGDMKHQAARFLDEAAPDAKTLMAADHEDEGVALGSLITFMQAVESEIGRKVVIYCGSLIKEQIVGATANQIAYLKTRLLWGPEYGPAWRNVDVDGHQLPWAAPWLWQYTDGNVGPPPHGVPGIQPHMDVNSYAGNDADLAAEWCGAAT